MFDRVVPELRVPYDCTADADFPMTARDDFTPEQFLAIKCGTETSDDVAGHPTLETLALVAIWEPEYERPRFMLADSDVSFGMSAQFKKDVAGVEKKLQGRILVAITEILDAPCTPRGDTVKPLSGELRGLWRYRIGDFRLVYRPSSDGKTVVLVSFASRGSVYAD